MNRARWASWHWWKEMDFPICIGWVLKAWIQDFWIKALMYKVLNCSTHLYTVFINQWFPTLRSLWTREAKTGIVVGHRQHSHPCAHNREKIYWIFLFIGVGCSFYCQLWLQVVHGKRSPQQCYSIDNQRWWRMDCPLPQLALQWWHQAVCSPPSLVVDEESDRWFFFLMKPWLQS